MLGFTSTRATPALPIGRAGNSCGDTSLSSRDFYSTDAASIPHSPATGAAVGSNAPELITEARACLATMCRCHSFLMDQGHPTSASHLEPLLRAARDAVLRAELAGA